MLHYPMAWAAPPTRGPTPAPACPGLSAARLRAEPPLALVVARQGCDAASAATRDPRAHTIAHLRAALAAGHEVLNPGGAPPSLGAPPAGGAATRDSRAGGGGEGGGEAPAAGARGSARRRAPPPTAPGVRSMRIDRAPGVFVAERDFLSFLLAHNVSVLDLRAGTRALLWKGERHELTSAARNSSSGHPSGHPVREPQ